MTNIKHTDQAFTCPGGCGCQFVNEEGLHFFECKNCQKSWRVVFEEIV